MARVESHHQVDFELCLWPFCIITISFLCPTEMFVCVAQKVVDGLMLQSALHSFFIS